MSRGDVACVDKYAVALQNVLNKAKSIKRLGEIEPALTLQDLENGIQEIASLSRTIGNQSFAAIETACRDIFYRLLVCESFLPPQCC